MRNVTKGDGRRELFSRRKIVISLEAVGLDSKMAMKVARSVKHHRGMTTSEIKAKVARVLRRIDGEIAERYLASRDLRPKESASGIWGKCLLNEKDMEEIDVKVGQEVEATDGKKSIKLRAYRIDDPYYKNGSVYISDHDLGMLNIGFGSKLAVRKIASA